MKRCLVLTLVLGLALALAGCSKDTASPTSVCPDTDAGAVVDPTLLAFLSRARAAHHMADSYEEKGELEAAFQNLAELVDGPVPGGKQPSPEAREVLADTHARMADLASQLGKYETAAQHVEDGLKLASETTYFRGHLYEVRGLVEDRRSKQLADAGDEAAAEAAKQKALEAYEDSMKIQAEVIEKALPDGKGPE